MFVSWKNYFLFSIIVVCTVVSILAETDPLLEEQWIHQIRIDEKNFYHRFSTGISTNHKTIFLQDRFHRSYKIMQDGRTEFIIDREYRFIAPDSEQLAVHLAEARALVQKGETEKAILVLKGMELCYRMNQSDIFSVTNYKIANKLLNQVLASIRQQTEILADVTDPYACYFTDHGGKRSLIIESSIFPYRVTVPDTFSRFFSSLPESEYGENRSFSWKISRYYYSFPREKQSSDWATALREAENEMELGAMDKIILTIGTSYHYLHNFYNKDNYFHLWDLQRGLTTQRKTEIDFKRKKSEKGYESSYSYVDRNGKKRVIFMNEQYYLRENRGIVMVLSYPEKYRENGRNIWNDLFSSVVIK